MSPDAPGEIGQHVDDGFDFPPTDHPGRELFTASLFVLLVLALLVWGGWKLISLMSTPRPHHSNR
jgi:hypothetical protein